MTADLTGPMEARLLALERRQARLDDALRTLRRQAVAVGQGIWDAWSEVNVPVVTGGGAVAPAGPTFAGCTGVTVPTTLYARDAVYGAITLTYDGSSLWTACKSVNFPGYGSSCGAVAGVAVHYDLLKTGTFRMRWASSAPSTTLCPAASTCATSPNVTAQQTSSVVVDSCVPFRAHVLAGIGGGFVIFGNAANSGVRVDFSASPL